MPAARGTAAPYSPHMRNEDDRLIQAVDESLTIGRLAGCAVHLAHLKTSGPRNWGKLDLVLDRVDRARKAGRDVTFDRYPYVAYQTGLTNLYPLWSRDGGPRASWLGWTIRRWTRGYVRRSKPKST